jgi:leucyl-tRNA synthetase
VLSEAKNSIESTAYPFSEIEPKWEQRWEDTCLFHSEPVADRPNWVVIELPPFANGSLHLGHVRNYTMGDVSARFRRMAGFNVLYTTGFDSFGLPNELAALEVGRHPKDLAEEVMAEMREQFVRLGLSHDTRRIIGNHDEQFYGWVQWVFLKLFKQGLAYRQRGPVNWCSTCEITLADSLAVSGKCWRCDNAVESRLLEQWLVRESDFADDMLESLERLKRWPRKIKRIHADWIGRRAGADVRFVVREASGIELTVFVAHPALLPCAALIGLAPEHTAIAAFDEAGLLTTSIRDTLARVAHSARPSNDQELVVSQASADEVVMLGLHAVHPLTGTLIPIAVCAGLDLRSYDGAAVLFPAHLRADARLAALAGLQSTPILRPPSGTADAFDWDGSWVYTNSGPLSGRTAHEGELWVIDELKRSGAGAAAVRYRLRDWNIARQRYWGHPIPIIHCHDCGAVPVPESNLPVLLPLDIDLEPHGNPLDRHPTFADALCPHCGRPARRDTDTLETYCSPWWYHWNAKRTTTANPFDKEEARLYMPVDIMIGGEDQARTCFFHLRMMARALKRDGIVEYDEPVDTLLAIGMVKADGRKMSKSAGNTVDPKDLIERYGADALRFAILAAAAPENDFNWSNGSVRQSHAFLNKVWHFCLRVASEIRFDALADDACINLDYSLTRKLAHQMEIATNRITEAMCQNQFHLAASNLEKLFDRIEGYEQEALKRRKTLDDRDRTAVAVAASHFLRMLTPLCPHITEELWSRLGGHDMIAQAPWPATLPESN